MFCHHCGETLHEGTSFCTNCGEKVEQQNSTEQENSNSAQHKQAVNESPLQNNTPPVSKTSPIISKLPIIIPIVSFLVVCIVLTFYYFNEQSKNDKVLELQQIAEDAALEGNFGEAIETLSEALDIRADYEVLSDNLEEIERAQAFSNQLNHVQKLVSDQEFDKADDELSVLKEQSETETGALFESFRDQIVVEEETITIGKIKLEIDSLSTVDALANRLSTLESLSSSEVDEIKTQILDKIVQITNDLVTEQLANSEFAEALDTINKGLSYKTNDEQLLERKAQVEEDKLAFEEAQEKSDQEDLHNRTAAVELTSFTAELNENGDVSFEGSLISTATIPIYSLTAFYAVYDANGQFLFEGFVYIDPYTLEPGDEGYFTGLIEDVNQEVTVEIYNITWYFDE
ncbi:zinc ribbon domain-containing protein [Oceanobacillus bengalensis]|uniref:Zinc-ribbon domain-containing protein n=1 Tax=Oceanobacillus bengalensis TaxID=1435466 RepID=A0A494YZC1_9BACI|nr:zinc ribbon domain-containing protein [Oceanobacillus bengalensis]RKQ15531.1 hypothetical protein D8M05_09685 [Oceanobacillus bengalensis]